MGAGASMSSSGEFEQVMNVSSAPTMVQHQLPQETVRIASSDNAKATTRPMLQIPRSIETKYNIDASTPPPPLLPHLRDIFLSKVKNEPSKSMPVNQFYDMVETLFIHVLSDFDRSRLDLYLDPKTDYPVSWREANEYFEVQFNLMKQRKVNLWVGIPMVNSNARYFWYNLRNDASEWMTDAETVMFMKAMTLPPAERPRSSIMPSTLQRAGTPKLHSIQPRIMSSPHKRSPCNRFPESRRSSSMTASH